MADVPLRLALSAGYGGGGNRTRVVSPQVWLSRAVYEVRGLPTAVSCLTSDPKGTGR